MAAALARSSRAGSEIDVAKRIITSSLAESQLLLEQMEAGGLPRAGRTRPARRRAGGTA